MSGGSTPNQLIPMAEEAAPRVRLHVQNGSSGTAPIVCRHIVTLIGSKQGCKVNLQHRLIAPVHVAIVNTGHKIVAIDLVTNSGTMMNGLKMAYERLTDGDVIEIGRWQFQVEIEEPTHAGVADVHGFDLDQSPHVIALEQMTTRRMLKPGRDVCLIGRRNGCDITIPDSRVSRCHCLLLTHFGYPAVCDLLSRNESLVNGKAVTYAPLADGDILTLGESKFRVRTAASPIVERASNGKKTGKETLKLADQPAEPDMIDIETTESSQRWQIVDRMAKTSRKR